MFLDEVGDLPLEMQPKLLRVIEEKEFERFGGTRLIRSDVRLIFTASQNLEKMVRHKIDLEPKSFPSEKVVILIHFIGISLAAGCRGLPASGGQPV